MPQAAREEGGSEDVFINDLPALRVGDSMSDGEIQEGSESVFINDKPAARQGDSTDDDPISEGSPDVETGP